MEEFLQMLGASAKESRAFLVLLELGAQPVGTLARQLCLPRSSTYLILEKLEVLGLIESFERNKIKYVECISVEAVEDLIRAKERRVKQAKELYESKLPELKKLESRLSVTPKIKHFEGKEAVMRMYEEVLRAKSFDAIFNPQVVKKHMPEYHYAIPTLAGKGGVRLRELLVPGKEAEEYKKRFGGAGHEIRFLPKGVSLDADIIITDAEIYMVGYSGDEVSATEIRNPILAKAQRMLFEGWWGRQ